MTDVRLPQLAGGLPRWLRWHVLLLLERESAALMSFARLFRAQAAV